MSSSSNCGEQPAITKLIRDAAVPGLVERASALLPRRVILIKTNVYDMAYERRFESGPVGESNSPVVQVSSVEGVSKSI